MHLKTDARPRSRVTGNSIRVTLTSHSFLEAVSKGLFYMQSKEVLRKETTGSADLAVTCSPLRMGKVEPGKTCRREIP